MTETPNIQPADEGAIQPQIVDEETERERASGTFVAEPSKLLRIASMTRAMLDEVRQCPTDEAGRRRLAHIYASAMEELRETLSADLQEELDAIFEPLHGEESTESELRIVQAQLVGWLEGLFGGIQASLWSQQVAATSQLGELRRRKALESGSDEPAKGAGQYL